MVVEATLEPEEILEHVEGRVPAGLVIHELYTALHNRDLLIQHHGVDHVEDARVDVVFGINDRHHLVVGAAQSHVQAVGLVDRPVGEDSDLQVGDPITAQKLHFLVRPGDSPGVVGGTDDHHLQQMKGVMRPHHTFDGGLDDLLLVPGGQHDGERLLRGQEVRWRPGHRLDVQLVPGVQHQEECVGRLEGQENRDHDGNSDKESHQQVDLETSAMLSLMCNAKPHDFSLPDSGRSESC